MKLLNRTLKPTGALAPANEPWTLIRYAADDSELREGAPRFDDYEN